MSANRCYGVLTGDVVKSSRLSNDDMERVRDDLDSAVASVRKWKRGLIGGQLEFFRGDAWQLLLMDPGLALRVSIFLRAAVLSQGVADSRISVGLGGADAISRKRMSLSRGEAFVLSGHGLDGMTLHWRMTIEAAPSVGVLADWLPIVGRLCDSIIRQWTERQAEIVRLAITPEEPSHEEIAENLSVSRQAITKGLDGANWRVIKETIHQFENTDWGCVLTPHSQALGPEE